MFYIVKVEQWRDVLSVSKFGDESRVFYYVVSVLIF